MPLTDKQREFLTHCSHRWNIKTGATRSGKTYVDALVTIPKRMLSLRGEGLAVMMGNTLGTLSRNVIVPMREIWGGELVGEIRVGPEGSFIKLFGRTVYLLGADNKKHISRIQGAAFEYCYGDEITTWSEGVFQMLKSRLSCPHSHFDGTCNPDSPQHWFKGFLDSDADIYCQSYTIDDNPTLPAAFVEALKKEYAGTVYYSRFILGLWTIAEGIIYRSFADSIASGDKRFNWPKDKPLNLWQVRIGVDFGGNGSYHAFVATGILPGYGGIIPLSSRRVDPKGTDYAFLAREFLSFVEEVYNLYPLITAIYCDSAEQTLINSIRGELLRSRFAWLSGKVHNSKKIPINDRIRLTTILMGSGRFYIMPQAATLAAALSTATWSNAVGRDIRLDDGSTDIDSLDAFEYTIERDYKQFVR